MIYYFDPSFNELDINPYSGLPYDNGWILLRLSEERGFLSKTGNDGHGLFQFTLSKSCAYWQYRFMDFIEYESALGKNIIVAANAEDIEEAEKAYAGHSCGDRFLREYEESVLVHSTTSEAYSLILKSGCLKSWNVLKSENAAGEKEPIGRLLGDPEDYSDYIMFGGRGCFNELVVLSKQKGEIITDIHKEYEAGVRMYFDAEKIAENGLLIRDGAHLKVRGKLSINPYLIWTATPRALNICGKTTPFEFADKADKMFASIYPEKITKVLNGERILL